MRALPGSITHQIAPSQVADLTLEDIASLARVSRSTVSRVINNQPNVSEPVRQRVWKIIQETGYRPHPAARSLASQHTSVIGLVIPRNLTVLFSDPYFPRLTLGVAQACNAHQYMLSLFLFHTEEDERSLFPLMLRRGLTDGLIVQSTHADMAMFAELSRNGVPFVAAGRPMEISNTSYVDVDNLSGAHTAVRHLIQLGRRRIATITGPLDTTVGQDRLAGYQKALREGLLTYDNSLTVEADFTEAGGYYAARRLLPLKPDALFVASDIMASGALRAITESGLKVPNDIALVSYDDLPLSSQQTPALTTVRQPIRRMGIQLVETLLDILENGPEPPRRIIFGTELIIRESCGAGLSAGPA